MGRCSRQLEQSLTQLFATRAVLAMSLREQENASARLMAVGRVLYHHVKVIIWMCTCQNFGLRVVNCEQVVPCLPSILCPAVNCGDPGTPSHGSREPDPVITELSNVVRYSCDEGYELLGSQERTCQVSGEWSGALPTCRSELGSCSGSSSRSVSIALFDVQHMFTCLRVYMFTVLTVCVHRCEYLYN